MLKKILIRSDIISTITTKNWLLMFSMFFTILYEEFTSSFSNYGKNCSLLFLIAGFTNVQMATQTFVTDLQAMNPTVVQVQVK